MRVFYGLHPWIKIQRLHFSHRVLLKILIVNATLIVYNDYSHKKMLAITIKEGGFEF